MLQARQVQEVFPAMTLSVLQTDLQVTRSVELTIENIVEGRLQQPQVCKNLWLRSIIIFLKNIDNLFIVN